MRQTWRWFGPADLASIDDIVQAGAQGVVTALHHVPNGVIWTAEEIGKRQQQIRVKKDGSPSGIEWDVIESLPVSEDIKKQKGDWREQIANYKQSLRHVAAAGLRTVCYNFMPSGLTSGITVKRARSSPWSSAWRSIGSRWCSTMVPGCSSAWSAAWRWTFSGASFGPIT